MKRGSVQNWLRALRRGDDATPSGRANRALQAGAARCQRVSRPRRALQRAPCGGGTGPCRRHHDRHLRDLAGVRSSLAQPTARQSSPPRCRMQWLGAGIEGGLHAGRTQTNDPRLQQARSLPLRTEVRTPPRNGACCRSTLAAKRWRPCSLPPKPCSFPVPCAPGWPPSGPAPRWCCPPPQVALTQTPTAGAVQRRRFRQSVFAVRTLTWTPAKAGWGWVLILGGLR